MASPATMEAIDLFCGAGGLSTGFSRAGFDIVAPVDNNDEVLETFAYNHNCEVLNADITKKGVESDIAQTIHANGGNPETVDVIIGGPPCKGFSQANVQTRTDENPLNGLPGRFLDIVEHFNPSAVVMENVPKILTMSDGTYKSSITSRLQRLGYNVTSTILSAEKFGAPQMRRRAFFIAVKEGEPPIPSPTHDNESSSLPDPISVKEAIYDLPKLPDGGGGAFKMDYNPSEENITDYVNEMRENAENDVVYNHRTTVNQEKTARRFKYIGPGENWKQIPEDLMDNYKDRTRTHDHIYRRLIPEQPAFTIANFRKQMMIHPQKCCAEESDEIDQNRLLSVREAARLQSFPDSYIFPSKSLTEKQQMVGNAVPVKLAEELGREIETVISDTKVRNHSALTQN